VRYQEDCDEYLDQVKLKTLLQRYSEFVQFPIELLTEKTEYEQIPDETAPAPAEGEKPKMKTVSKKTQVWEQVNRTKVSCGARPSVRPSMVPSRSFTGWQPEAWQGNG
jgi:HSP90 family molecular chaperone